MNERIDAGMAAPTDTRLELRHFKTTLDLTRDCIFMFDPATLRFFYVNQGAVMQVGYSAGELLQMTAPDIKPDYDETSFREMLAPLLSGELSSVSLETRHRHKEGHDVPVEIFLQYIAPDAEPPRFVAIVRDIAARKRVERALEQSEALFRALAQVAPVGIFRTDASGACTYVNEHYCKIAGIKPEAALGGGWASAIHPDDRAHITEMWRRSVGERAPFNREFRFRRPTGHITWVVGQAREELGSNGELLGYVGTLTDISERKEHEAALQRFNEELEQRVEQRTALLFAAKEEAEAASRSKSLFLTSMSHELRTPLNAILGYAQLMQIDTGLPAQAVENAHEIKRAGDYLLALLNDVLDLARIESGRMEIRISVFELSEVIRECRAQNTRLAASRNIALVFDDNSARVRIRADSRRLLQVLNNLVSNAIKYNCDGGRVTVSCAAIEHGRVRISVADTGPGIAPDKLEQLFQPFNRLGAEMGKIEGTGIGLVICRRLLEAMDGIIGVDSTQGEGSAFRVELPAPENAAAELAPQRARSPNPPRVLVAEDYAPNQNVLRLQLQTLGCEVDIVPDGDAALKKYRAVPYDLILTDLNMPVMDGPTLAMAVREDERLGGVRIPIIAVTAAALPSELERCRAAGMDATLTKPISLQELSATLTRWLGAAAATAVYDKTETAPGESSAILNLEHLYHILGQVDLVQARGLIATFLATAGEGLTRLESQTGDRVAVAREMHKQKSSARTVGALLYAQLAEDLERQAKEGDATPGFVGAFLGVLRYALIEIGRAETGLHEAAVVGARPTANIAAAGCKSVLIVDDDPVILQQMTSMLAMLGVGKLLTARNGLEAIRVMAARDGEIEVLLCDLNMPEMDGVELIREFGKTGFDGGLILMSGADEKVLNTVSKLAGLQGLRVLGQLRKPLTPARIAPLLARSAERPAQKRPAFAAPEVSADALREAMAANEFSVWFQPKVDSSSLHAVGVEALARWKRADGRFVPPDIFITVAEQEGLIGELSQTLVASALTEGARLFDAGFPLKIAVNLSGRWLNDLNLPDFIFAQTQAANLQADDVILEVTETGVMEDLTTALDVLTRLRIKGFGLSIDDFGIGYSSFEQLGRIPFTEMKLDRSFVSMGTQDAAARAILESSMDMARKLGLSTVAEGVETAQDLELVRTIGCDRVQGYLIAKPMPVEDLIAWLRDEKTNRPKP